MRDHLFESIVALPAPVYYLPGEIGADWHSEVMVRGEVTDPTFSFLHEFIRFGADGTLCGGWYHEKMPNDPVMRASTLYTEVTAEDFAPVIAAVRAAPVARAGQVTAADLPALVGGLVCVNEMEPARWLISAERRTDEPYLLEVVTANLMLFDRAAGRVIIPNSAAAVAAAPAAFSHVLHQETVYESLEQAVLTADTRETFIAHLLDPAAGVAAIEADRS